MGLFDNLWMNGAAPSAPAMPQANPAFAQASPQANSFSDPQAMALFGLAQGLFKAGGASSMPVGIGAALGQGIGGALSGAMNAQQMNQRQSLVNIEQLKAQQLQQQLGLQAWALGAGPMPQMGMPAPAGPVPQDPSGIDPKMIPAAMPGAMPSAMPGIPGTQPPTMGGPLAGLSPEAQRAIRLNIGLPGAGTIAMKDSEPVIGREGGIYKKGPDGSLTLDPGWIAGEQKRLELQRGIEDQHTLVPVPLANGQTRQMTKAQALNLTGATNQIVNAIPGLDKEAVANIQSQLAAEPDKPINVDMNIGGRPVKMTLQPIGGGFTSGQTTEARAAQEKSGTNAGDVQSQIDSEASSALQSRKILGEMRGLASDFTPSKIAPMQRALGEWAQALKLPGDWATEIKSAESQQALQKLTAQMATAAMKQFTNRGTQMEFKTFLQNNPNAELTSGGFQKVLEFMDRASASSLDKQQAYQEWRKMNPVERSQDFLADWNKRQNAELSGAPDKPSASFVANQVYTDAKGNRARYLGNNKWQELK
jgi:hypothetical protein